MYRFIFSKGEMKGAHPNREIALLWAFYYARKNGIKVVSVTDLRSGTVLKGNPLKTTIQFIVEDDIEGI